MTQTITGVIAHQQQAGDLTGGDRKTDGAGYGFDVQITMPYPNTNQPPIDIRIIPPGGPFPDAPNYQWVPTFKAVQCGIDHSGTNLIVWAKTHQTGVTGLRTVATEYAVITGVWHVTEADRLAEGGPNAFIPTGGGGGDPVDYDQVEVRIRKVLGIDTAVNGETLAHRISGINGDYRQGLEDKAKSAAVELLTGTDQNAQVYKAALYQFLKDAAANPLANVLGGQDAWGAARRAELVAIVREGSHSATEGK